MCTSTNAHISQLADHIVKSASISGKDTMNGDRTMILEFFKAGEGHAVCEGEVLSGTRHYYFPFNQMDPIKIALTNKRTIKVAGALLVNSNKITGVDWEAV